MMTTAYLNVAIIKIFDSMKIYIAEVTYVCTDIENRVYLRVCNTEPSAYWMKHLNVYVDIANIESM
jgi:hypothetical protein